MTSFSSTSFITYKSFQKTIETDPQVFRWFLYLISQENVKKDVKDLGLDRTYRRFALLFMFYRLFLFLCLLLVLFVIWKQQYICLLFGAPLIGIYFITERMLKKKLFEMSLGIVSKQFNETKFKQNTLFQICETLARHYGIESLVDGVVAVDMAMRKVLIFSVFVVVCIQLLNFWKGLLTLFLLYCAGLIIVNITWIYKSLMK